jgi:hypothetical protein
MNDGGLRNGKTRSQFYQDSEKSESLRKLMGLRRAKLTERTAFLESDFDLNCIATREGCNFASELIVCFVVREDIQGIVLGHAFNVEKSLLQNTENSLCFRGRGKFNMKAESSV